MRLLDVNGELDNARAWLFTVATNLALDAIRTRQRRWKLLAAGAARAPHGDPTPTPDVGLEAQRQRVRVHAALQTLSEKERQVLLMREEGFAQREIAAAVGTTTKSVGTLIARALRKLARTLDSDREEL